MLCTNSRKRGARRAKPNAYLLYSIKFIENPYNKLNSRCTSSVTVYQFICSRLSIILGSILLVLQSIPLSHIPTYLLVAYLDNIIIISYPCIFCNCFMGALILYFTVYLLWLLIGLAGSFIKALPLDVCFSVSLDKQKLIECIQIRLIEPRGFNSKVCTFVKHECTFFIKKMSVCAVIGNP